MDKLTEYALRHRCHQLETAIREAVAYSNRTWCANWTQKHFPRLVIIAEAGIKTPLDPKRGGEK